MKQQEQKFGERPPTSDKLVYNQFIRNGKVGEGESYLTEEQKVAFGNKYQQFIVPYLNKFR